MSRTYGATELVRDRCVSLRLIPRSAATHTATGTPQLIRATGHSTTRILQASHTAAAASRKKMGLAGYVCFMTALSVAAALLYTPSMQFLEYVQIPRYYVVRRVDYLHYRVERVHYLLRFVASGISVRVVRGAEAFAGLVSLVGAATVLNLCMEVGLRVTGQRQMRLRAYSRLPSALAVLVQAFFEGGMRQRGCAFSSVPAATPSPRLTKRAKRRRLLWHVLRLCAAFERGR